MLVYQINPTVFHNHRIVRGYAESMIDRILISAVEEVEEIDGEKVHKVKICYNFVGDITE